MTLVIQYASVSKVMKVNYVTVVHQDSLVTLRPLDAHHVTAVEILMCPSLFHVTNRLVSVCCVTTTPQGMNVRGVSLVSMAMLRIRIVSLVIVLLEDRMVHYAMTSLVNVPVWTE